MKIVNSLLLIIVFGLISCEKDSDSENGTITLVPQDIVFNSELTYGTVKDIDENEYKTILIGDQEWMAENLRVTHYRNGDEIPRITEKNDWINLESGAYCNPHDDATNALNYGKLYNYYTIEDSRNICPEGWHIPTGDEWRILIEELGNEYIAGGKLKEIGITHWSSPNSDATNTSGFTALPGGSRTETGIYHSKSAYFWSSEENGDSRWLRMLFYDLDLVEAMAVSKKSGISIRCIKNTN